jgi:integrase
VFHSFRHTVKDALRDFHVEDGLQRKLLGHAGIGEADKYGRGFALKTLDEAIQKLYYPGLELPVVQSAYVIGSGGD